MRIQYSFGHFGYDMLGSRVPGSLRRDMTAVAALRPSIIYFTPSKKPPQGAFLMERAMGLEPTISAWKANVLPLHYARNIIL